MNLQGNHPLDHILSHREVGYIAQLLPELEPYAGDDWEVYLFFQLSAWKGDALEVSASSKKKLVLCVCDESPNVDYPFLDKVDLVFRTYLPANKQNRIHHLPVGPSSHFQAPPMKDFASRRNNVFFSGNLHLGRAGLYRSLTGTHLVPFPLLHRLKRVFGTTLDAKFPASIIRFSTGFHNGIAPADYAGLVADSKIILCPAGIENPETMRHFEAAQCGSIVMTLPLPDVPVYRQAPFVVLPSWRELDRTVRQLLAEPSRMLDLHHQTVEWWQQTASPAGVAAKIGSFMARQ